MIFLLLPFLTMVSSCTQSSLSEKGQPKVHPSVRLWMLYPHQASFPWLDLPIPLCVVLCHMFWNVLIMTHNSLCNHSEADWKPAVYLCSSHMSSELMTPRTRQNGMLKLLYYSLKNNNLQVQLNGPTCW